MRVILILLSLLIILPAFALDNADVWKPYLQKIEKDTKASWYNLSGFSRHNSECKINLFFNIKNNGNVSGEKVLASDCPKDMNELALKALKQTAPFAPFPKAVSDINEISIDFIFDYKLLPENKVSSETKNVLKNSVDNTLLEQETSQVQTEPQNHDDKTNNKNAFVALVTLAGVLLLLVIFFVCKFFKMI